MTNKEQITYEKLVYYVACEEALAFFLNMLNGTSYTEDHLPTEEQLKTLITRTPEFEYNRDFIEFAVQTEIREWIGWFWYEGLLPYISLGGIDLSGANLEGADLRRANLQGADLQEVNLKGANLQEVNLKEANLFGAKLEGAILLEANLLGANLRGANLIGANLIGANLKGANLKGADMRGAKVVGAILLEADLKGANLNNAHLEGIWWNSETIWPVDFTLPVSA